MQKANLMGCSLELIKNLINLHSIFGIVLRETKKDNIAFLQPHWKCRIHMTNCTWPPRCVFTWLSAQLAGLVRNKWFSHLPSCLNSKTCRRTFTRLALTVTWTPSFQFQPIIRSILFGDLAPSVISSETQSKTIYRSATCPSSTLFNCEYA